MISRIDKDTIVITTEKIIKIPDLEAKIIELQAIDVSAKAHNDWVRKLPADKFVHEMPETEQEIVVMQEKIDEYKAIPIKRKVADVDNI